MNIGIDIDGTLTDIKNKLDEALITYLDSINKLKVIKSLVKDKNDGKHIQVKYNLTDNELKYFFSTIHENITNNALPRKNVVNCINKFKT